MYRPLGAAAVDGVRLLPACAVVILLASGCSASSPVQPALQTPRVTTAIQGDFFTALQHSRQYVVSRDGTLSVRVSFLGDYSFLLWIEVWRGGVKLGEQRAQGFVHPKKRLDVPVQAGNTYEVRLWTDKCCARYEGFVDTP